MSTVLDSKCTSIAALYFSTILNKSVITYIDGIPLIFKAKIASISVSCVGDEYMIYPRCGSFVLCTTTDDTILKTFNDSMPIEYMLAGLK